MPLVPLRLEAVSLLALECFEGWVGYHEAPEAQAGFGEEAVDLEVDDEVAWLGVG